MIKTYTPGGIREMIAIALPMVVSFSCDTLMIFTDRLFLAKLGASHMDASMGGGLSSFMVMSFFIGLTGYTTALAAQYLGANQKSYCPKVWTQAALIILSAYPIVLLLKFPMHAYFDSMGLEAHQLVLQKTYFDILILGSIISLGRHSLSAFFSGIGRTRIVMIASLTALCVNVAAAYILIFGKLGMPPLGMSGAAYGIILGWTAGFLVLLTAYLSPANAKEFDVWKSFRFDRQVMAKLLRFGYPAGLEMSLTLFAFTTVVFLFHSAGPVSATATTILFNWDLVTFVPLMGIEIGVTSLVGRYLGAQQPDIAHRAVMSGLKIGLLYSLVMLVLFVFFPKQLVEVFRPDGLDQIFMEAMPIAVTMIKLVALYVSAAAVLIVFVGALRGAGDTLWAMTFAVGLHWILVPVMFVMLRKYNASTESAWATFVGIFLVFCILPYLRYRQGKWKNIRVVDQP